MKPPRKNVVVLSREELERTKAELMRLDAELDLLLTVSVYATNEKGETYLKVVPPAWHRQEIKKAKSTVQEVTTDSFDADVLKSSGIVLVVFTGDSCPSCRLLTPVLMEVAADLEGRAKFLKIDVERNMNMAHRLGVTALPTVLVFSDGEMRVRMVGLQNKKRL